MIVCDQYHEAASLEMVSERQGELLTGIYHLRWQVISAPKIAARLFACLSWPDLEACQLGRGKIIF